MAVVFPFLLMAGRHAFAGTGCFPSSSRSPEGGSRLTVLGPDAVRVLRPRGDAPRPSGDARICGSARSGGGCGGPGVRHARWPAHRGGSLGFRAYRAPERAGDRHVLRRRTNRARRTARRPWTEDRSDRRRRGSLQRDAVGAVRPGPRHAARSAVGVARRSWR